MQIHELNNFTGTLGAGAYLAIDDGTDTGKISSQGLLAATEARIDNIIAGPAPSAEEIVDARLGDDGVTYPSLGDAIRDQFSDVKSDFDAVSSIGHTETAITRKTLDTWYFYDGKLNVLGDGYVAYAFKLSDGGTYKIQADRATQYAFVNELAVLQTLNHLTDIATEPKYFVNSENFNYVVVSGNYPSGTDSNPRISQISDSLDLGKAELLDEAVFDTDTVSPTAISGCALVNNAITYIGGNYKLFAFPILANQQYLLNTNQQTWYAFTKEKSVGSPFYGMTVVTKGTHTIYTNNAEYNYLVTVEWTDGFIEESASTLTELTNNIATLPQDYTGNMPIIEGKVIVADETSLDFGKTYDVNEDIAVSDYIDISKCTAIAISVSAFTNSTAIAGLVFYNANKEPVKGVRLLNQQATQNVVKELSVLSNYNYVRTTILLGVEDPECTLYLKKDNLLLEADKVSALKSQPFGQPIVRVAALNASSYEKSLADYICDGENDEVEIQNALDLISDGGEVWLSSGTFNIDSFTTINGKKIAIPLSKTQYGIWEKTIRGAGKYASTPTIIIVTSTALSSLGNDTGSVFGVPYFNYIRSAHFKDFEVFCADNQHKYTVIDNSMFSAGSVKNLTVSAVPEDIYNSGATPMPVTDCVGVTGYCGDDNGALNIMECCFATGFYEGYRLGGEHLVCTQLNARYNYYGYTFGNYDWHIGTQSHPLTLINCCDEHSAKMPKFVRNGNFDSLDQKALQQIDLIGFNLELFVPENFGGGLVAPAEESVADTFCGRIDFTAYGISNVDESLTEQPVTTNQKNVKFWADGSGRNFITRNMVHKQMGTSAVRQSYTPTFMQQYFDTTLNKMLVYNGTAWVDMSGNAV